MAKRKQTWEEKALNSIGFGFDSATFDSSVIARAWYCEALKNMRIRFVSGNMYDYDNVGKDVWRKFKNAKSQGKYFNKYIRGQYPYKLYKKAA